MGQLSLGPDGTGITVQGGVHIALDDARRRRLSESVPVEPAIKITGANGETRFQADHEGKLTIKKADDTASMIFDDAGISIKEKDVDRFIVNKDKMLMQDTASKPRAIISGNGAFEVADESGQIRGEVTQPRSEGWCGTAQLMDVLSYVRGNDAARDAKIDGVTSKQIRTMWGTADSATDLNGDGLVNRGDLLLKKKIEAADVAAGRRLSEGVSILLPVEDDWCDSTRLNELVASTDGKTRGDGTPDYFKSADLNSDTKVDVKDRDILYAAMGKPDVKADGTDPADLNRDGRIDRCDDLLQKKQWLADPTTGQADMARYDEIDESDTVEETRPSRASPVVTTFSPKGKAKVELKTDEVSVKNNLDQPKATIGTTSIKLMDKAGIDRFTVDEEKLLIKDVASRPRAVVSGSGAIEVADESGQVRGEVTKPRSEGWCGTAALKGVLSYTRGDDAAKDAKIDGVTLKQIREKWGTADAATDLNGDGNVDRGDELLKKKLEAADAAAGTITVLPQPDGEWCDFTKLNELLASSDGKTRSDGTPDYFKSADRNGDGKVDVKDRDVVLQDMGKPGVKPDGTDPSDLNSDGKIDRCDDLLQKKQWLADPTTGEADMAQSDEIVESDTVEETRPSRASPVVTTFSPKGKAKVELKTDEVSVKNNLDQPKATIGSQAIRLTDKSGVLRGELGTADGSTKVLNELGVPLVTTDGSGLSVRDGASGAVRQKINLTHIEMTDDFGRPRLELHAEEILMADENMQPRVKVAGVRGELVIADEDGVDVFKAAEFGLESTPAAIFAAQPSW